MAEESEIFGISSKAEFEIRCLETFCYQYEYCPQYRAYSEVLGISPENVTFDLIPFLPIRFFKQYEIISKGYRKISGDPVVFSSSSTTGMVPSKHVVLDISLYEAAFTNAFRHFYGDAKDYVILALLPAYLERKGSSLVYMADRLIRDSGSPESGFFLYDHDRLHSVLSAMKSQGRKVILLGVSFALLDFAAAYSIGENNDSWLTVMETGGMKGRKEEISRTSLHDTLSAAFGLRKIHSEYGMCELLSQAYSDGDGIFRTPAWMRIVVKDMYDPFRNAPIGTKGVLNIIDLANINSCSFIETEDMGISYPDGSFTIEGRLPKAERRGCNMLIED